MQITQPQTGILETTLTTRGDIIRRGAAISERLALGTVSYVLMSDGTDTVTGQIVDASVADGAAIAESKLSLAGGIGEGHITILPMSYSSIGAGTWSQGINANSYLNGYFFNTSSADADNASYKVYLAKGTYTLRLVHTKASTGAIVDIDIDGVEKGSVDLYAASTSYNEIYSVTGIVVAASGLATIRLRSDGRNGSASGYTCYVVFLSLWRTA